MYKRKRLGPLRTVAIRNSEVGRYSGGVNVQYEWQKKSVPEVASAIWSQSAIGEVRYRRFHCIYIYIDHVRAMDLPTSSDCENCDSNSRQCGLYFRRTRFYCRIIRVLDCV